MSVPELQVMQFWKKAERVVAYKQQSQVEARKKEAMDKHLTFLVDQTQKYSTLLAQRLADSSAQDTQPSAKPVHASVLALAAPADRLLLPSPSHPADTVEADAEMEGQQSVHSRVKGDQGVAPSAAAATTPASQPSDGPAYLVSGRTRGSPELGSAFVEGDGMDDEEDFQACSASDVEDDEATLEEEEVRHQDSCLIYGI